jgi:hypothetical protein
MKTCAIHQPNFFPWLGYFDKIKKADVFVFLDNVDYPKSGSSMSSWCNRVKLDINNKANWVSCPLIREHGIQKINSVKISSARNWKADLKKSLIENYKRSAHFDEIFILISEILDFETIYLADFNINAIKTIAGYIGLSSEFIRQSELIPMDSTSTDRLIDICLHTNCNVYLSGAGGMAYQDDAAFQSAGIKLVYQNFFPQVYGDKEKFIPGLSVLDWLMKRE